MGDGGRDASGAPERLREVFAGSSSSDTPRFEGGGLFGPPSPELAAAVEAAADPLVGSWPDGARPDDSSTDPWQQVVHAVVAGRRIGGWVLWAQLSMLARWVSAWRSMPPASNTEEPDRCEDSDPSLTERMNVEIGRVQ